MENLNEKQREASEHRDGPILIAAGAGSGKTKTLTSKLINLLKNGVAPENVIAITFTNKAAQEMRDRISKMDSKPMSHVAFLHSPFIGTFHSLGARILKAESRLAGRTPSFTIFDDDDSLSLIRKIMKEAGISKEDYNPLAIRSKISSVKNELLNPEEYLDKKSLALFRRYEEALEKNNAFDFDDLIEKIVRLFDNQPTVLEKYQNQFRYILVDEYQDVNTSQYQMVRLLAEKHQNLSVVGDDAQCLLPDTKITTLNGIRAIKNLKNGQMIISASGNGKMCKSKILKIHKYKYNGNIVKITTSKNKLIKLTPNHLLFTRLQTLKEKNVFYVYLMYRKDKGFRIGITRGIRWGRDGKGQIGLIVRNNQEKADKVWILKVCNSRPEAEYYEYYYGFNYGIPTVVFDTANRSMKLTQEHVNKIFSSINTISRAKELMLNENLYFEYPHWLPQGTIRHSSKRLRIRLTLFDDRRKSILNPWGMSRISVNTKDTALKNEIEKIGLKTRRGKLADWRMEIMRLNYSEIEKIANKVKNNVNSDVEIVRSACLTKNKRLFFQPAAHARPSMAIAVKNENFVTEDEIKSVDVESYSGWVYDLDIENTHNYIANDFVVHNSIYGFRGSDFRNFLNFDKDWPKAKVVLLEQNYRSSGNIITAASEVIKNNKHQKPKTLWTENTAGELIKIIAANDAEEEANFVSDQITSSSDEHRSPRNDKRAVIANDAVIAPAHRSFSEGGSRSEAISSNITSTAILYRTNAQSRSIEQALIQANIPYRIFGGLKFYERKEIKDVVAALRLAANPKDTISAERIEKTFNKPVAEHLLKELPRLGKELKILELINFFLANAHYFDYLEKNYKNYQEREENIKELIVFASKFSTGGESLPAGRHGASGGKELPEFLERIMLLQSADQPARTLATNGYAPNPVSLMTIHLAKGLEFDNVFVIGCSEGLLPHQMSYGSLDDLEEERRLMYVAMTRAKKELFLGFYNLPSRFLGEIPPELTDLINLNKKGVRALDDDNIYIEDENERSTYDW